MAVNHSDEGSIPSQGEFMSVTKCGYSLMVRIAVFKIVDEGSSPSTRGPLV